MHHILIIGCGDIGKRVARLWINYGRDVFALLRNTLLSDHLRNMRIEPIIGDLDNPATLTTLPVAGALVYYSAPPPDEGDDDPRMRAFIDSLAGYPSPEKIVYISTTGVYGDCHGNWVTEQSPVKPQNQRSKRRLAAETILKKWHEDTHVPVVILRVAGIYGPGRLPIGRIAAGQPSLNEKQAPFSNRIHSNDLARICIAAALHSAPHNNRDGYRLYNVSDGHPSTMTDYFNRVAAHAGLKPPRTVSMEEASREFSPMMLSFLNESKRVDNRKMLQELDIKLLYPDLKTGLKYCQEDQ